VATKDEAKVEKLNMKITAAQGHVVRLESLYISVNGGPERIVSRPRISMATSVRQGGKARDVSMDSRLSMVRTLAAYSPPSKSMTGCAALQPRTCRTRSTARRLPNQLGTLGPFAAPQMDGNVFRRGLIAWRLDAMTIRREAVGDVSSGYRNQYDFVSQREGEMFATDGDMEWITVHLVSPTRVTHATSGSELGWR